MTPSQPSAREIEASGALGFYSRGDCLIIVCRAGAISTFLWRDPISRTAVRERFGPIPEVLAPAPMNYDHVDTVEEHLEQLRSYHETRVQLCLQKGAKHV